jgi:hypothetical protein
VKLPCLETAVFATVEREALAVLVDEILHQADILPAFGRRVQQSCFE